MKNVKIIIDSKDEYNYSVYIRVSDDFYTIYSDKKLKNDSNKWVLYDEDNTITRKFRILIGDTFSPTDILVNRLTINKKIIEFTLPKSDTEFYNNMLLGFKILAENMTKVYEKSLVDLFS